MKDPHQTLLEVINHCLVQHPNLMPSLERIIQGASGDTHTRDFLEWQARSFAAPPPAEVKHCVLLRNNLIDSTWVETGTWEGDTTEFLSHHALHVHTIEPGREIYDRAKKRLAQRPNITMHNDTSEVALPTLLPSLSGNVCFWLDGHYSGVDTFKGPNDTPLREELKSIAANVHHFKSVVVLVDDIRLCGRHHIYGSYPSLDDLVEFAKSLSLNWYIEHDIFVAKTSVVGSNYL